MTKLLIYIPIYNAENRIRRTLEYLTAALKTFSSEFVRVHIVDNASTDNTARIVQEFVDLSNGQISLEVNKENVGGMLNIFNGLIVDVGQQFTWMIGDDDFVSPWSLETLFSFLDELDSKSIKVKFIHVNTLIVSNEIYHNPQVFNLVKEKKASGWLMNQKFTSPTITQFKQLVDPRVDGSILGFIGGCIFDSKSVRDTAERVGYNHVPNSEYLYNSFNCEDWYPHVHIFSKTFLADDLCLANPTVSIITTIQHQLYLAHRAPIFGCGSLDSLFELLDNGVINLDEFESYVRTFFVAQKHLIAYIIKNRIELYSERKREVLLKTYAWFVENHLK